MRLEQITNNSSVLSPGRLNHKKGKVFEPCGECEILFLTPKKWVLYIWPFFGESKLFMTLNLTTMLYHMKNGHNWSFMIVIKSHSCLSTLWLFYITRKTVIIEVLWLLLKVIKIPKKKLKVEKLGVSLRIISYILFLTNMQAILLIWITNQYSDIFYF